MAFTGVLRFTRNVSGTSAIASLATVTLNVADVCPARTYITGLSVSDPRQAYTYRVALTLGRLAAPETPPSSSL